MSTRCKTFRNEFVFRKSGNFINTAGVNFAFTWDLERGGEMTKIFLHDGKNMLEINSEHESVSTVPNYSFIDADQTIYALSNCKNTEFQILYKKKDEIKFTTKGRATTKEGLPSPWIIEQTFRVFKVGVVFCDVDISMEALSKFTLSKACITFGLNEKLCAGKFRWMYDRAWPEHGKFHATPFTYLGIKDVAEYPSELYPYVGANFGIGKNSSFTNHAEFVLEDWKTLGINEYYDSLDETAAGCRFGYEKEKGMLFTWNLYNGKYPVKMKSPYRYTNRWGLGVSGCRKSSVPETPFLLKNNILGSRIYHWCNVKVGGGRRGSKEWYPTNAQIDEMAKNGCSIFIMHNCWMPNGGCGRQYRADYEIADEKEYKRVIDHCHSKNIRVGVYIRGLEYYQLDRDVSWFTNYLKKNYDGIYVDWTSFLYPPSPAYKNAVPLAGEKIECLQPSRTHVPALGNFLYTKKLRELVGENGFLIGHPGDKEKEPTTIAMIYYDAVLVGESNLKFTESIDKNIYYSGLIGNGATVWGPALFPRTREAKSLAYYAAFDNNPQMVLGCRDDIDLDPCNQYPIVLWKMYQEVDQRNLTVYNPSIENREILKLSNPDFRGVVYKDKSDRILMIVSNLGGNSSCSVKINFNILEVTGQYTVFELKGTTDKDFVKTNLGKVKSGILKIGTFKEYEYRGYLYIKG